MMGAMMARAAGWDNPMQNVTVNKYRTPTANNRDCEWSVGVMNLTEREADLVGQFARGIRSVTSDRARGLTATQMREQRGPAVTSQKDERAEALKRAYAEELAMDQDDRRQYLTGRFTIDEIAEAAKEPEPEEVRNRFSGLDIE